MQTWGSWAVCGGTSGYEWFSSIQFAQASWGLGQSNSVSVCGSPGRICAACPIPRQTDRSPSQKESGTIECQCYRCSWFQIRAKHFIRHLSSREVRIYLDSLRYQKDKFFVTCALLHWIQPWTVFWQFLMAASRSSDHKVDIYVFWFLKWIHHVEWVVVTGLLSCCHATWGWNAFPAPNQPARLFGFCRLGLFHWHMGMCDALALARQKTSTDVVCQAVCQAVRPVKRQS